MLYLVVFLAAVLALAYFAAQNSRPAQTAPAYPYVKCEALFTPTERSFLGALEQSVGGQYRIMGKVRLGDIVAVEKRIASSSRQSALNRINSKHVDFVLCDPQTLAIRLVVELDDRTHERADRKARDEFVNAALAAAGVPIARIPARSAYSVAELSQQIEAALKL